jgi:glucose-1-phosphate thymidylyltransferase
MKAFILAGGFATRLWPLTEKRAKPLLPLAGKPILTHLVEKIPEGMPIAVSTNQVFAEYFHAWSLELGAWSSQNIKIIIEDASEEERKLGAVGAFAAWIQKEGIDDDVLLLAGDNYIGFSLTEFLQRFHGEPLLALFDIRDREKAKAFGVATIVGDRVKSFEEKPQNPKSTLVSTGVAVIPKELLREVVTFAREKPDNMGGIFEHFLAVGIIIRRVSYLEPWFDIGSFEAYLEATKALVGEKIQLEEGSTCIGSTCGGSVVLGNRSRLTGCRLEDVVVFDDCTIEDCILRDCVIDDHCMLRGVDLTGKMIRQGTVLLR